MEYIFILMGVVMVVGAFVNQFWLRAHAEELLTRHISNKGYEVRSFEIIHYPSSSRYSRNPGLARVVVLDVRNDEELRGKITWNDGLGDLSGIHLTIDPRQIPVRDTPPEPEHQMRYMEDSSEAGVMMEVNRRLDEITAQPNWMEPYDLDGSGHIDEEEWSILRNQVVAQVRAELGTPGVHAVLTPQNGMPSVEAQRKDDAPNPEDKAPSPDESQEVLW